MPRRTSARTPDSPAASPRLSSTSVPLDHTPSQHTLDLRRQWKWAAFSQFFFTFNALFAMNDVYLADIEEDLVNSAHTHLPRVIHRLLLTLTQDRKISMDNWQSALRKQYYKRNAKANPLGPEPVRSSAPPQVHFPDLSSEAVGTLANVSQDEGAPTPSQELTVALVSAPRTREGSPFPSSPAPMESGNEEDMTPAPPSEGGQRIETIDWLDLPMLRKLDSLHDLIEWQFHNPMRLRAIMKDDDEAAHWRIEPIGYDAKRNAYWLIGADRLWIQRAIPKLRKTLKRKHLNHGGRKTKSAAGAQPEPTNKRHRYSSGHALLKPAAPPLSPAGAPQNGHAPARGRAAKTKANVKIDAQSKALLDSQRLATPTGQLFSKRLKPTPPRALGTRVSLRLRGDGGAGEWQPIPDEWLAGSNRQRTASGSTHGRASLVLGHDEHPPKTGLESDVESISDLTELSEDYGEDLTLTLEPCSPKDSQSFVADPASPVDANLLGQAEDECSHDEHQSGGHGVPEGFIEWETICVKLDEWEHVAERFAKATHYAEKSLYKVLTQQIVPVVTEELREIERKRRMQEAVVHRKRSSRIAIKESEKEEARLTAKRKAEEEEKLSRARRLQARLEKEEADRARRDIARARRQKDREDKERQQTPIDELEEGSDAGNSGIGEGLPHRIHRGQFSGATTDAIASNGTRTPGEDWELDCEICFKHGINQDDGSPMMCCNSCSKWQHIRCHDQADVTAGRPKRDWDVEDFVCQRCQGQNLQSFGNSANGHGQISFVQMSRPADGFGDYVRSYPQPNNGHLHIRTHYSGSRPAQSHNVISFNEYQPHQHSFSPQGRHATSLYANQANRGPQRQYKLPVMTCGTSYRAQHPSVTAAEAQKEWSAPMRNHSYASYGSSIDQSVDRAQFSAFPQSKGGTDPASQWALASFPHSNSAMGQQQPNHLSQNRHQQTVAPHHTSHGGSTSV